MLLRNLLVIIAIFLPSLIIKAQGLDSLSSYAEAGLSTEDSLSIFKLIDSLLSLEASEPKSQLGVRLAYNSNMLSTGRTLGINQFGLNAGVSYYHKSGFFTDLSGFWSDSFDPSYYLTILSAGYMHTFSEKLSVITSFDHYSYTFPESTIPFSYSASLSGFVDLKPLVMRLDYIFYFGDYHVHRVMPSLGFNIEKKGLLKLDKVSINPIGMILLGNEHITEIIFPSTRQEWIVAFMNWRRGMPWYTIKTSNVFGIMNYSFLIPLQVNHRQWSFFLGYAYNIPKSLKGEIMTLDRSGFLTASIIRLIDFRPKK